MKIPITSILIGAVILLAPGCSSPGAKVDTGTIPARTFTFISPRKPAPEFVEQRQHMHTLLQGAIVQSLARRNVTRVEQGGDVTVAYLLITGNSAVTTTISDYFGYGRDSSDLSSRAHSRYGSSKNPNYFEAGTLLIDIIDSNSWKLLKRGYVTRVLQPDATPEQRATRVQEAVDEILSSVRFK